MPSPYPGMDPFIEAQEWSDFHVTFNAAIAEQLQPIAQPNYVLRLKRREYVERHSASDCPSGHFDFTEEQRETYLVIRERETQQVVTVIETLSPANKRPGSDGRREYLEKRQEILDSPTHLVELDLLRAGLRLPMQSALPPGDYYAIVSRARRRPQVEIYAWPLLHRMPKIPIPLAEGDADIMLDLQSALDTVYGRAMYELSLEYTATLDPPLSEAHLAPLSELRPTR